MLEIVPLLHLGALLLFLIFIALCIIIAMYCSGAITGPVGPPGALGNTGAMGRDGVCECDCPNRLLC